MNLDSIFKNRLEDRKAKGLLRKLPSRPSGVIDFTTNDYLGLSQHPEVVNAAVQTAQTYGVGGLASRLLGASADIARDLETRIAAKKSSEEAAALTFSSGFQTNHSVVATLLDQRLLNEPPIVFSDRAIHASLHSGIAEAESRQQRFRHNDLNHLETLLAKHADTSSPKFVIVESLYSMDGDLAPLDGLYELKSKYGFILLVDDAHATGVFGEQGYGLAEQSSEKADIVLGTFSKALGCSGGYVVCSQTVREALVNFAKGFVYSTAPSPVVLAAARAAWGLLPSLDSERNHVLALAGRLRSSLTENGFQSGDSQSQIVPILIGDDGFAINLAGFLESKGVAVAAIRPPTVPPGTSRLRVSLSATRSEQDVDQLVSILIQQKSEVA